jgi:predicted nucleotidyltransferase
MTPDTRKQNTDLTLAKEYARRLRVRLKENLQSVTLFGSRARGDSREGSDFDLIVKVKRCDSTVRDDVQTVDVEMMNEFGELFVGMIYSEDEWRIEKDMPLGWNVAKEGVPL